MTTAAGPITLLFTDLVNSSALLQQADDESAQRILRAHHTVLRKAVAAHGAPPVRWLGDGLLSVFVSTADAVRCAVDLQHAARRRAAGERLSIRVGLHVAPAMRDETDFTGRHRRGEAPLGSGARYGRHSRPYARRRSGRGWRASTCNTAL